MKILHQCRVSPPPKSIATTTLPLTFFDIPFFVCSPMRRLFFYEFPLSTSTFMQSTLPLLIHSLSVSLRHFFPFAANLLLPPPPQMSHILYSDGDSLLLTVVESTAKFSDVIVRDARDVALLHPFVPQLPPTYSSNGHQVTPIMAIQVTLFPNQGICIGVAFLHVVADGRSFTHFMKSWASIHRSQGDPTCLEGEEPKLPFHDRTVIRDPNGLKSILLKEWWNWSSEEDSPNLRPGPSNSSTSVALQRATFTLQKSHLDELKTWISNDIQKDARDGEREPTHVSTFVVSCALAWVCYVTSQVVHASDHGGDDKRHYFVFFADCRNSNRVKDSIPPTYFGNCLNLQFVSLEEKTLVKGATGILAAARAMAMKVKELGTSDGRLRGLERWITGARAMLESGNLLMSAGSPQFKVYDTDFGWGRPRKCDFVHIDISRTISLAESRDEKGGVEIGLALPGPAMETFIGLFERSVKPFSNY